MHTYMYTHMINTHTHTHTHTHKEVDPEEGIDSAGRALRRAVARVVFCATRTIAAPNDSQNSQHLLCVYVHVYVHVSVYVYV